MLVSLAYLIAICKALSILPHKGKDCAGAILL